MLAVGVLCLVVALVALMFYLRTSYVTQGGSLGQDPCIAAATVQVPLLTLVGLGVVAKATGRFDWPWWQYLLAWFIETLAVAVLAVWVGRLGGRCAGRDPK